MYRALEFIVLDGVGFYGGYSSRHDAEQFAEKIGGKVACLPSQIVRRVINPKRSAYILRTLRNH